MDSYYSSSSNFGKLDEDAKRSAASSKLMDSDELNRSSKHIDSGVCVESLSSVSSILTSSSSLSSNYSSTKKSTNKHSQLITDPLNSSTSAKYSATKDSGLLESAELYEYDYDEKDDEQTDKYEYKTSTDYDLIKDQELINKNYLLSNADLLDTDKDGNT